LANCLTVVGASMDGTVPRPRLDARSARVGRDGGAAAAPHLLETWATYVRDLCAQMTPEARRTFREQLLGRTRAVAEAAGGFLGVGRVSAKEQAVLAELERAFAQR
jgi:hypothetical protein